MRQTLSFIGLEGAGLIIYSGVCYLAEWLTDKLFKL
jgi:hypothetical protein